MTTRVELFRSLHDELLLLPCAWDVTSAAVLTHAGFPAIATTSAGMSWAAGLADGDGLSADRLLQVVEEIGGASDALLTVDVEDGYSDDPDEVVELLAALHARGVVGVNIEDASAGRQRPVDEQAARLAAVRAGLRRRNLDLFLNARIDTWLAAGLEGASAAADAARRAEAYAEAGADGVFVPGVDTPKTVQLLAQTVTIPVNVMATAAAPIIEDWAGAGARRVSTGMSLAQIAYGAVQAVAERWAAGSTDAWPTAVDFGTMQDHFAGART